MPTFDIDQEGFAALARSPEIRAAVVAEAERGKAIAEGLAAEFTRTGAYARSFNVRSDDVEITTDEGPSVRAAGILENTSDHALAVEFGNAHDHQPHFVLARTLDIMNRG